MNKGIVLKIKNSSVVVLTSDGRYLKCKRQLSSYMIGQEIQFPNQAIIVNKKVKSFLPKLVPVMIASVLIFMTFLLVDWNKKRVMAAGHITVESKAKISLIVDKQLNVINIKALNGQGKDIVKKMDDWNQESLQLVMDDLIVELKKNEVILANEKINISGSMEKKYKNEQIKLNKKLEDIQKKNPIIKLKKSDKKDQSDQNKHRKMDEYNKIDENKKETDDVITSKDAPVPVDEHGQKNKSKSSLIRQNEEYKESQLAYKETNQNEQKNDKENRKKQTNIHNHQMNSNENHYPKHNKSNDDRKNDDTKNNHNKKD